MESKFRPGQVVWYTKGGKKKVVVWDCGKGTGKNKGITICLNSGSYIKVSEDLLETIKYDIEEMTQADLDAIISELDELRKMVNNA